MIRDIFNIREVVLSAQRERMHAYLYVRLCVYMFVCIHTYIHIHIFIYITLP